LDRWTTPATRPCAIWKDANAWIGARFLHSASVARALREAYCLARFACIAAAGALARRHIPLLHFRTEWGC